MELKQKKHDNGVSVLHDTETNDPIAVVKENGTGKNKRYSVGWHPTFKQLYPAANDLSQQNFDRTSSINDVKNHVAFKAHLIINDRAFRDALKVTHVGKITKKMQPHPSNPITDATFEQYHIHADDGTHIATMNVGLPYVQHIGLDNNVFARYNGQDPVMRVHFDYHGDQPTPDAMKLAITKHPGDDPVQRLHQIKYWYENRNKEPKFIGSHTDQTTHYYKTKLSPEVASEEYMKHMKGTGNWKNANYTRLSPTLFVAKIPAEIQATHYVDTSTPGSLSHTMVEIAHNKRYGSNVLNHIIE